MKKDELAYSANHNYREGYTDGREDAINDCIEVITHLHSMYDVIYGDWSNCYQINDELQRLKERKNEFGNIG